MVPSFSNKEELLRDFVKSEKEYVNKLSSFRTAVIDVLDKRDTEDKRRLKVGGWVVEHSKHKYPFFLHHQPTHPPTHPPIGTTQASRLP